MMANLRVLFLVILFLPYGCRYGMTAQQFPAATSPRGIHVQLTTDQTRLQGELVEVRADGLLMDVENKLRFVPYASIVSSHIEHTNLGRQLGNHRVPNTNTRENLRLVSRFPQGLTPELLQQLLTTYGQTQVDGPSSQDRTSECRDVAAFIECARNGTAKYKDQSVAILDGYRRIGSDFPAMGQHWIKIGLLFDAELDAKRPEVLTYVVVSGKPELAGVAYALPLLEGESAPDWPVPRDAWHDHFRSLEDETIVPHHGSSGAAGNASRLAMLHAWLWLKNPEGTFAADNWAIPYRRLGIVPPEQFSVDAAKALALVSDGSSNLSMSVEGVAVLTETERASIRAAFTRSKDAVKSILDEGKGVQNTSLENVWAQLWKSIDESVGPDARQQLQHIQLRH